MTITAGLRRYAEVNDEIKETLLLKNKVIVNDVNGQRYIGCALDEGKTIEIHGTAGNDLACYLNGGKNILYGHGQDAVGNTMNGGEMIIHGHTGDALGYGMRDGQIFVRGAFPKENLYPNIKVSSLNEEDKKELEKYVKNNCKYFGEDSDSVMSKPFKKLTPVTSRPYANLYTQN